MNSALQRARRAVDERLLEQSQQETLRSLDDEQFREIVERYGDAWANGDVEALRALLAKDATFSMPPWEAWWHGRETIAGFARPRTSLVPTRLPFPPRNGQVAIAYYHKDADTGRFAPAAIEIITFEGAKIKEITAFVTPRIFLSVVLPPELAP